MTWVCPIVHGALDIDSDGRTISCIEKGGTNDYTSHGNIFETRGVIQGDGFQAVEIRHAIHDVLTSPSYLKEVANARRLPAACRACDERMLCQANCGVLHEQWNPAFGRECPGFKTFIKRVRFLVEEEECDRSPYCRAQTSCLKTPLRWRYKPMTTDKGPSFLSIFPILAKLLFSYGSVC